MKKYAICLLAFVSTSAVMMTFEFANHLLYPFPETLDTQNLQTIQEFSKTLPTFALVMILLGWFFGTMLGVCILHKYLKIEDAKHKLNIIYVFASLLTALAVMNNCLYIGLGNRFWFEVLTLPFFFIVTHFTLKYLNTK